MYFEENPPKVLLGAVVELLLAVRMLSLTQAELDWFS